VSEPPAGTPHATQDLDRCIAQCLDAEKDCGSEAVAGTLRFGGWSHVGSTAPEL
jgi:hypothetical protein